ncbi:hypothetical protein BH23THE1_BH23THE1_28620 [soil metagenome]
MIGLLLLIVTTNSYRIILYTKNLSFLRTEYMNVSNNDIYDGV